MDTKHKFKYIIWFLNIKGKEIRLFYAYSRQYKLLVLQVYDRADRQTDKDFLLNHVLKEFPFKINQIQVDSGIKFLGNFE